MYNNDMLVAIFAFIIGFITALIAVKFRILKRLAGLAAASLVGRKRERAYDFLDSFGETLATTTDLRSLLERAAAEIQRTFSSSEVSSFVYYSDRHLSAGSKRHERLPFSDIEMIRSYLSDTKRTVITDSLASHDPLRRLLVSHQVALVVPLGSGKSRTGFMLVGDRRGVRYSKIDADVLSSAGKELAIAVQNSLSLHEVKELNETLQQRVDIATNELRLSNAQLKHLDETKDEFISMASHQLRTPLTSVKGYISMVLEGDAGKVSAQQRKLLTEAFNSSERMVRLIGDFLNVSRLQTGKFLIDKALVNIKDIVRQESDDLNLIAKTHNVSMKVSIADEAMMVTADEAKIRQVVMNFIDNAIYYSPPKSLISVKLSRVGDALEFTVVDQGIGVPADEQAKLFTKFFRANNARRQRPDGTGVGLYLARRIVHGHGGSIIFDSTEGKGSTFGFRLPLDKN